MKKILIILLLFVCLTLQAQTVPVVSTTIATNISHDGFTTGGNVTSAGGGTVSARGVCYATTITPTITDPHTSNGTGVGVFTSTITGVTNGIIHVRAYATNETGTGYGGDVAVPIPVAVLVVSASILMSDGKVVVLGQIPPVAAYLTADNVILTADNTILTADKTIN